MNTVDVPFVRLRSWLNGFVTRNGQIEAVSYEPDDRRITATTDRGGTATIQGAWDQSAVGDPGASAPSIDAIVTACAPRFSVAVILLRRGGFSLALATVSGAEIDVLTSKTDSTYVQGRTAAGGQSQQRFARRRSNQADKLVKSAETAAHRVFADVSNADMVITGGDRPLLEDLLTRSAMAFTRPIQRVVHVPVPTPKRRIIDEAITTATSLRIQVENAGGGTAST